ncbi:MAG: glycosyltransferase family 2 protein [Bacteroidota bacterium]
MNKIAVVILNWNGKKFLEQFLPQVVEYSTPFAHVVVADNASSDDSIAFLKLKFPEVQIIQNATNGGFSKGYNDALKLIDAEYYCLLNSDIEVTPNWIQPIIELMDSDSNIAVCQPKLRSWHEPEKFEYAGAAGGFIDKYGYPFCRGRMFMDIEDDENQYDDNREVFWATGACMFVRAELYHKYGGLDEDFFAHMEEIDFCWRMKNVGYKVMYCAQSTVFHVGGGTLPKKSSKKTYLNFRNNILLLYKNLPKKKLLPVFFVRLILDIIAAIRFLFDSGSADAWAVVRAHANFYGSLRYNLLKRNKLPHRHVSMILNKNLVLEYFFKHKKKFSNLDPADFS